MEDRAPRYAVYFVPAADSDLYRFGSSILQYDCYSGEAVRPPEEFAAASHDWRRATEEPRRYGFHATLKAPFHLSPSCTEAQLVSALRSFAGLSRGAAAIRPAVQMLSGFAAVLPGEPVQVIDRLAADSTMIFDAFRAPISAQERARRVAAGLNRSQIENLNRWGYPYLLSEFHFHMTLTGKMEEKRRDRMFVTLQAVFRRMCGDRSVAIDRLTLVKQESRKASFRVLSQVPLNGAREL
jgi:hypothetical protein